MACYGQLFDGGYRREWIDTEFADDAVWTIALPVGTGSTPIVKKGRQAIERFFAGSDAKVASAKGNARLVHVIVNAAVLDQSAQEAHVATYELVGNSLTGREPGFQFHTTARIEGRLTMEGGAGGSASGTSFQARLPYGWKAMARIRNSRRAAPLRPLHGPTATSRQGPCSRFERVVQNCIRNRIVYCMQLNNLIGGTPGRVPRKSTSSALLADVGRGRAVGFAMLMLPVADLERASRFYQVVFGWKGAPIGPDAVRLTTGDESGIVLVASAYLAAEGAMTRPAAPEVSLGPTAVISVASSADVDRHEAMARQEGATVTSPARARDFSVYSVYFSDPDANGWEVLTQI